MSLIECPECGKQISDKAKSCPNCGCPIKEFSESQETIVPTELSEDDKPEMFRCVKCNKPLPVDIDKCIYCGYIYGQDPFDLKKNSGAKHIHECTCTCLNCGNKFSFNNIDVSKNKEGRWTDLASTYSVIGGSRLEKSIANNHQKQSYTMDFEKCPNCGSRKITKEYNDYYINSDGEYLEDYEPTISDKISEKTGNFFSSLGDFTFKGCLLISLIPFILLLYALFQILKAIFIIFF